MYSKALWSWLVKGRAISTIESKGNGTSARRQGLLYSSQRWVVVCQSYYDDVLKANERYGNACAGLSSSRIAALSSVRATVIP